MQVSIDLMPFLCEAFGSNQILHKDIERIYEKNKVEYYQLAKASEWYNHELITCQSIFKEIAMKRVLAILIEGNVDKILYLIRKGWRSLYNYALKAEIISIDEYLHKFMPKNKQQFAKISNDEFNSQFVIVVLLSELLGKKLKTEDIFYTHSMEMLYARQEWVQGKYRYSLNSLTKEDKAKIINFKEKLYLDGNINRYWMSHATADIEEIKKYSEAYSVLFDTEGLSSSIIEDEILSERDIEEILGAYFVMFKNRNVTEGFKFLAAGHIIKALLKAYKRLKEEHFKSNKETLYLDLETAHHKVNNAQLEVDKLKDILKIKDNEILNLRKQVRNEYGKAVKEYQDKLKTAENTYKTLREEVERLKKEKKDLELVLFTSFSEENIKTYIDLSNIKGIIVGGHDRWQNKMKEVLPDNWRFIALGENISLDLILNSDYVFFNTNYLSHAVYYAVIGEVRKRNIPVGYIKKTNEAECLDEIQKQISRR